MSGAVLHVVTPATALHHEAHRKLAVYQSRIARNLGRAGAITAYNALAKLHAALPHRHHLAVVYGSEVR
jgi:hypothetical protein